MLGVVCTPGSTSEITKQTVRKGGDANKAYRLKFQPERLPGGPSRSVHCARLQNDERHPKIQRSHDPMGSPCPITKVLTSRSSLLKS